MLLPLLTFLLPLAAAQRPGNYVNETHPPLQWTRCTGPGTCTSVNGSLVLDANMRWIHDNKFNNCFMDGRWHDRLCDTSENCTKNCVIEGLDDYKGSFGIATVNDSVSLKLRHYIEFGYEMNPRVFLLEDENKYQTFVLLGNEFAFDVDLSTVECGINSALYFVGMDADGGMARFPANEAGAKYGTGYCDAQCPRDGKFVRGKANSDYWMPPRSETYPPQGNNRFGSCCPEFAVWDSNAHSYSMSSHNCPRNEFHICEGYYGCESLSPSIDPRFIRQCDPYGCNYNPTRMGVPEFYGKGKVVDTTRKFTVITRFEEDRVYQIFVQDGKRIDTPAPGWEGLPKESGLTADICSKTPDLFEEFDRFGSNGGWNSHKEVLSRPMVLALSISTDSYSHNLWLDGVYPPEGGGPDGIPGQVRGDCPLEGSDPYTVVVQNPRAKATWSNIRFGPVGSTVQV
ncbi:Exoglucanase 1 [Podospora aff. communis PSN243]|uniref:Glucanase n=1 Tax=Podospora aff. communis PSN243 TaxID=3040156 RepID=A0AAV9G150_9PEZI|nr:Exoglucanase 1 [Podospora aff. communis PSN243]